MNASIEATAHDWETLSLAERNLAYNNVAHVGPEVAAAKTAEWAAASERLRAARPEHAIPLYQAFLQTLERELGQPIAAGEFGADMKVSLTNDGPVTICMDSQNRE